MPEKAKTQPGRRHSASAVDDGLAQYALASGWKFRTLNLMDIMAGLEGRL